MPIRVLICDDHALLRSGLRKLLGDEPDVVVTGEAGRADEAVALAADDPPDVILLDVTMPGKSGIEVLPELAAVAPGAKTLMLSMQDDPAYVRRAFAAGASGYLLKDSADEELAKALHEVARGHRYVHPLLGARLATTEAPPSLAEPGRALSSREQDVLRLLALGHTNHEIAEMLVISIRTVETHRARIMQKLDLRSRAEIVRFALTHGGLGLEQPA
jgi:two-component system, NarL family, response regulator NreC